MKSLLRAPTATHAMMIYWGMVSDPLGPENISPEILQGVEARQHRPERQGGDDRNPHDRAQPSERA